MDLQLRGKRALVTGASRGIGRAIAETLAEEGCSLALCARGAADLETAASQLRAQGAQVHAEPVDVTDHAALAAFVDRSAAELGGLDVVVSNVSAGAAKDADQWQRGLDADVLGLVRLTEAAVPHLERSRGSIVSIGTTNAVDNAWPSAPNAYSSLKAAVVHYASAQAHALGPRGIRVNTVSPGPVFFEGGAWATIKEHRREAYDDMIARSPVGRIGTPQDVAAAVAFLASPLSGYTNGAHLVVDGGITSRVQL